MKVVYYADDGMEFDTEEECIAYENRKEKEKQGIFKEIYALNNKRKRIFLDNFESIFDVISEVFYVMFTTIESAEYFDTMQEEYGLVQISNNNALKENEVYLYDDRFDYWISANDKLAYYESIIDEFKEYN